MPTNTTIGNASGTYDIVAGTQSVIRVGNGADTVDVSGGAGSTITIGNGLDNVLATDGTGNLITVGNGNDTITLSGGSGNSVTAGSGNVVVNTSGESDDKITVGGGSDTITAGANSAITDGNGADTITAGGGSVISAGAGNDVVDVNGGVNDSISLGNGNDKVTVTGGTGARIQLGGGNDTVTVRAGSANTITLGGGNDAVNASSEANDKITVGNGVDTVSLGADSIIVAGGGNDTITAGDNSVITTTDGVDTLSFGGLTLNIATSGGGDVITAGANSSITAGDGADTITAGSGSTIKAGNGNDTIVAGAGSSITAGSATDSISLFGVRLAVTIADGNDTITAGDDSTIVAGDGNDTITAGAGSKITVGAISNTVSLAGLTLGIGGENGADTITAGANSIVTAGNGAVTVNAGNNDIVTVGNGNDAVFMGASDTVAVGSGKDTFAIGTSGTPAVSAPAALTLVEGGSVALPISASVSSTAFGQDVITGFIAGKDVLQFSTSQFANAAAVLADAQQVGQNTVISIDAADTITLDNISKSSLNASDFAFVGGASIGSGAVTVTISGIPSNVSLSDAAGALAITNGSVALTAAQLAGLTLQGADAANANLTVTAVNATTGASTSQTVALTVDQAAPALGGATSDTVTEGGTVTLGATDAAAFGDDTLGAVTITGLPTDLSAGSFNGGAYTAATGAWTGSAAQFNALTFAAATAGTSTLAITATTTGADAGAAATASYTLTVDQAAPALAGATSDTVTEGGTVTLGATDAAAFGDDTLGAVTITGLPTNLSAGSFNGGSYTAATGAWTGSAAQFNALTFAALAAGTSTLAITATTTGTDAGAAATASYTLTVDQAAPALGGATSDTVTEGGTVTLGASDAAAFGDDTLGAVTITGLPTNLSAGSFNGGAYTAATGVWTGSAAQFNALTFAALAAGTSTLAITATTTGTDAGAATTETYALTVDQAAPVLAGATSDTVTEGGTVTLGASVAAAFGDDTLGAVTITGLPTNLSAGSFTGGTYTASSGAWTGSAAQFNALTFAALAAGTSTLAITATTTGADAGEPATETYALTVDQAAPVLGGATSDTLTEGGTVTLGASDAAAFGDETLGAVTITGLPTNLSADSFTGGTYTASSGAWTGSAAQFNALTFAAVTAGTSTLAITATTTGTDAGAAATESYALTVDQAAPQLGGATSKTTTEGAVTLGATDTAAFADDTLGNVTITGLSSNASNFNGGAYTAATGTWMGAAAQFNALSFTASAGTYTLGISAATTGAVAGAPATENYTLTVDQAKPVLTGATSQTLTEGVAIALGITDTAAFSDDTLGNVTITGLYGHPANFNGGAYTAATGAWTGTAAQFNALSYTEDSGTYSLDISAGTTGTDPGATANLSYSLTIEQGAPVLGGATSDTVTEGGTVTLGATDSLAFPDDVLGNVTITGLPADLSGFDGGAYTAATGTWTGTEQQFKALKFTTAMAGTSTLSVSATTSDADPGAPATETYTLTVDQAAPVLAGAAADTATEGGTVTLGATDAAAFGDDTLGAVTISGLPTNLSVGSFNGGTYTAASGAWIGSAAQFNALQFTPATAGTSTLAITATTTGADAGAATTASYALTVDQAAPALGGATSDTATEGGTVTLGATDAAAFGDDVLGAVTITGLPTNLSAGSFNGGTYTAASGAWTGSAAQFNALTFAALAAGTSTLAITATTTGTDAGEPATETYALTVDQAAPVLAGATSDTVTEGGAVTLGATVAAAFGDDTLGAVTISGLPANLSASSFNGGVYTAATGVWTGSAAQFNALQFNAVTAGTSTLAITATTTGADVGAAATESYTLTVDQAAPVLAGATSDTATEGGAVTLGASDAAAFGDDTLGVVTITGLPTNLSAGSFNGGAYTAATGVWTGSAAQFNALSFTAGGPSTATLTISATTTGANAGEAASEIYALNVDQASPVLGGATSTSVAEGGSVTLGATDTAAFSDDTLGNVTITGLPSNLTAFNGGAYTAATGTWIGAAAQFNALTFDAGRTAGASTLTISATASGLDAGAPATENYTLSVDAPVLTNVVAFNGDGSPSPGLIVDAEGDLLGTASGGVGNTGIVFKVVNNGTVSAPSYAATPTVLASFNGGNGDNPTSGVIADANGDLLGTTLLGGASNDGTVFEIKNNGTVSAPSYATTPTVLASLNGANGSESYAGLVSDANGDLFGTTEIGGANDDGVVFEIKNNGTVAAPSYATTPTVLVSFTGGDGSEPVAGLIVDANGDLLGTTVNSELFEGTVFEIRNNGTVSAPSYAAGPNLLATFNSSNGAEPTAALIADAKGDLFGTTVRGGANNDGTVFEIKNNGTVAAPSYATAPTVLVSFTGSNGENPERSLLVDANGDLFGTTTGGGASSDGTVFEIVNNGTVAAPSYANTPDTLVNFTVSGEGDQKSGLTVDANGDLFGTTATAIFEITNTGFVVPDPLTVANGASFEIASASEDAVTFGGATGTLQLDQSQSFVGTVAGFGDQDRIDFGDITYGADTTLDYTANSSNTLGMLSLSDGVHAASFELLGQYSAASFAMASDGHGGTMLTEPAHVAQNQLTQPQA